MENRLRRNLKVMRTKWESFGGKQYRHTASVEPRVTLGVKGVFYMNGKAFEVLGSPRAVELFIDPNGRMIGMREVCHTRKNAFEVKMHGTAGSYRRISASAFLHHFRIKPRGTLLFSDVDLDIDGMMVLDLNSALNISRGAR